MHCWEKFLKVLGGHQSPAVVGLGAHQMNENVMVQAVNRVTGTTDFVSFNSLHLKWENHYVFSSGLCYLRRRPKTYSSHQFLKQVEFCSNFH